MGKSRSRSRSNKKKKDKHHKRDKESPPFKERKQKDPKLPVWHGRKDEGKTADWREDKLSQGEAKVAGYAALEMIRRERAEEKAKEDRNFQEKGWTKDKVKMPLNLYEKLMGKNIVKPHVPVVPSKLNDPTKPTLIEVLVNDRLGKKERVKCSPQDTVGQFKKLIAAKTGTRPDKIRLQRQHQVLKDHITLEDYEVMHEMQLEMYYN